jgi:serine/threonine protein phosphatase PrpC
MTPDDATRPLPRQYGTAPLSELDVSSAEPAEAVKEASPVPFTAVEPRVRTPGLLPAALRDVGRQRQVNQDSIYYLVSSIPRGETDFPVGLFVVADGMGGHDAGEVASRLAINAIARTVLADMLVPSLEDGFSAGIQEIVISAVQEANRAIWDYARDNGLNLGTTSTVALVLGRTVYIGHVGDSRAYLIDGDTIKLLTDDHSAVGRLIQLGQLEPEEAREHPLRSQLYRTVGQMAQVEVDVAQYQLGLASHLLLCSDGLWGMVDDPVLHRAVVDAASPQDACRTLIDLANEAGGEDNISALVVQL